MPKKRWIYLLIALLIVALYLGYNCLIFIKPLRAIRNAFVSDSQNISESENYINREILLEIKKTRMGISESTSSSFSVFPIIVFTDVVHSGIAYFRYSHIIRNVKDSVVVRSAEGINASVNLEKINGKWKVVKWRENP